MAAHLPAAAAPALTGVPPAPLGPPGPARHVRLHAIDALRGIAAVWVLLYHVFLRYPWFLLDQNTPLSPLFPAYPLLFRQAEMGLLPVLWFFLISGFVITWTIDRCRTPMDFVVSRASRLYPAYWAALTLTVLLTLLHPLPGMVPVPFEILVNLTMAQDLVGVPAIDGVYWSLGVELRFYLFALMLFALGQWRRVHLAAFAWMAAALVLILADKAGLWVPWRLQQLLILPHAALLGAGMMLYRLWQGRRPAWSAATLALAVAAIFAGYRLAPALTCLPVMALLALSARMPLRWLAVRPLVFLGAISYSLYLCNQTVAFSVLYALDGAGLPHIVGQLVAIVASILLAAGITFGIERPALHAIRRLWRRRVASASPSLTALEGSNS